MQQYIYHGIPEPMEGNVLKPLNRLKYEHPDRYAQHVAKYADREELLHRKIPLLNCLWNDVLQFLPIHPEKVFRQQLELGLISKIPAYRFFEIDTRDIDRKRTVVYFKNGPMRDDFEVKWLDEVNLADLQDIPSETVQYYKSLINSGELPFNYQFIPHILYLGNVNISGTKIITL